MAIRQYFTCQLFLLVILLATEVTKQLPFNSLIKTFHTVLITAPAYQLSYLLILTLNASRDCLLRSCPSTGSILHDEYWCINKANNCRSWLTNHRRFNFTTRNVQTIIHASLCAFGMVMPNFCEPPKAFIILLNYISQLIWQYFTCQLVQVSLFANILSLQNFPMYGNYIILNHENLKIL